MAKNIYDGKVSKRGRGRPRLTFENTVYVILNFLRDGRSRKKHEDLRKACRKRLMTVDEAKEVFRDRSLKREAKLS